MTRFRLSAAALAASALLWCLNANANTITINGGISPSSSLLATGPSPLDLPATTLGNFMVSGFAQGTPPLTSGSFLSDTIAVKSSGQGGILFLYFTEQGITSPFGNVTFTSGLTSNLISSGWNATLSTFVSPTNSVAPPNGTPLDAAIFTNINNQSSSMTVDVGTGPYSLQEVYRIQAPNGSAGSANLTIDIMASGGTVIPEPATLAFLGTGLVAIGGLLRRRRKLL